jgi:hypothetical protein
MFRRSILLAFVLLFVPRSAFSQACCAGTNALTPARLPEHEWLLFGAQTSMRMQMGSWSEAGKYVPRPLGAAESDFELDLYAAYRTPWKRLQVAAFVPIVLTTRAASGVVAAGGGLGDMNFSLRLDAIDNDRYEIFPGIAVLAGVTVPSGTAPESATRPLAVDASGTGSFRGVAGLSFEKAFGPWLVDAIALMTLSAPRNVGTIEEVRAPGLAMVGAVTHVFTGGTALGASLAYNVEWDAFVDGKQVADSSRRVLHLGFFGLHPLGRGAWRVSGSVTLEPPIAGLGQNELAGVMLLAGVQRGF